MRAMPRPGGRGIGRSAMRIRIGYDLRFVLPAPTPMHLLLHAYPNRYFMPQPEQLTVTPFIPFQLFYDLYGNRCTRLLAPAGPVGFVGDAVVEVDGTPDLVNP